ncbi:MAG: type II toxin-antitoxin system VapC family toxin [Verrucomicrobiota bacterium]
MTGIDTNVFVRYVTQDDPIQSRFATEWIESHCTSKNPGWINRIVLCELVWVLSRGYRYTKKDVTRLLDRILETDSLEVESPDEVRRALHDYTNGDADFSDYLLVHTNLAKKVRSTITLDQKAATHSGFLILK